MFVSLRSGGRVWDDDVRRSAKRLAEMHDVKSFVASQGWLTGFRKRYGLKQNDEQGDIMIEIDVDSHQSSQNQHHQQQHHASPIEYGHRYSKEKVIICSVFKSAVLCINILGNI